MYNGNLISHLGEITNVRKIAQSSVLTVPHGCGFTGVAEPGDVDGLVAIGDNGTNEAERVHSDYASLV